MKFSAQVYAATQSGAKMFLFFLSTYLNFTDTKGFTDY